MSSPSNIKVLVTGFGPFLNITTNPSWSIAKLLPPSLTSTNGTSINLIVPEDPIPAVYHKLLKESSDLIALHEPHIVVHMGLAVERDYFAVEQSALKEGYHDIPDMERKVITRMENKKLFGKGPDSLATSLDLDAVVSAWQGACASLKLVDRGEGASKVKAGGRGNVQGRSVDVRLSDDVGTYTCGLIYYNSLMEMQKKNGKRDVVFFHVPPLEGNEQVNAGVEVTKKLIVALVDVWEARV